MTNDYDVDMTVSSLNTTLERQTFGFVLFALADQTEDYMAYQWMMTDLPTYLAGEFLRMVDINPEYNDYYDYDYYGEDYYYGELDQSLNLGQIEALAIFYQWDQVIMALNQTNSNTNLTELIFSIVDFNASSFNNDYYPYYDDYYYEDYMYN